jgi:hypothetical protein
MMNSKAIIFCLVTMVFLVGSLEGQTQEEPLDQKWKEVYEEAELGHPALEKIWRLTMKRIDAELKSIDHEDQKMERKVRDILIQFLQKKAPAQDLNAIYQKSLLVWRNKRIQRVETVEELIERLELLQRQLSSHSIGVKIPKEPPFANRIFEVARNYLYERAKRVFGYVGGSEGAVCPLILDIDLPGAPAKATKRRIGPAEVRFVSKEVVNAGDKNKVDDPSIMLVSGVPNHD